MPSVLHNPLLPGQRKGIKESSASTASSENDDKPSTSAGVKRGCNEVRGKESRKKKRGKSDEAVGTDDWSAFKRLQQKNERFEKSMKMLQENQKM